MYKCKYCGKEFEKSQQIGGHTTFCKKNPNREKNCDIIRNGCIGKKRPYITKKRIVIKSVCEKCGKKFEQRIVENGHNYIKKFCSLKCANGHQHTEEWNKNISNGLKNSDIFKKNNKKRINIITPKCKVCSNFVKKPKNIYCSTKCKNKDPEFILKISKISKKKCESIEERIRLKNIGRCGGFGKKGYTKNGIRYESLFEKEAFEYLEMKNIYFVPHKKILKESKYCDIYLPKNKVYIELDGIDREKKKKYPSFKKTYDCWMRKIKIYEINKLQYYIFKKIQDFKKWIDAAVSHLSYTQVQSRW